MDWARFPGLHETQPSFVEVAEGDLLYLPPAWFHHGNPTSRLATEPARADIGSTQTPRPNVSRAAVEALEQSASVNSWSYTADGVLLNRIFFMPLPLEAKWDEAAFQSVLTLYMRTMVTECDVAKDATAFLKGLLASRFETLPADDYARLLHPTKPTGTFTCLPPWDDPAVTKALTGYRPGPLSPRVLEDAGPERAFMTPDFAEAQPFPRGLRRRILSRARAVCSMIATTVDPAVRAIMLEDYFQDLIRHFIGMDRTVPYLRACFASP